VAATVRASGIRAGATTDLAALGRALTLLFVR